MRLDGLSCLSLSARDGHAVEAREGAHLAPERIEALLKEWRRALAESNEADAGLFYLGTCHRVELYSFGIPTESLRLAWSRATGADLGRATLVEGSAVLDRLVRVTASLESEVLGETQITGQMRDATEFARKIGVLHGPLDSISQFALRVAKRIRSETKLGEGTISVAHVAVDGLLEVFESLEDKSALVLGAGSMAEQALVRLRKLGLSRITWSNRSPDRLAAHPLAAECEIAPFANRHAEVWRHDIVVAATSAESAILRLEALRAERATKGQGRRGPRVILDLGLPRNVDEKIHGFSQFYVRNVDEFSTRIRENEARRQSWAEASDRIVEEEVREFARSFEVRARGPLVGELYRCVEALRLHELTEKNLEKNSEIDYLSRTINSKMMHLLVRELDALDDVPARQVLEVLLRAWRQAAEWQPRKSRTPENPEAPPPSLAPVPREAKPKRP